MLIGATYDWNGRGINDIEPSPTVTSLSPHYDSIDLRDYMYYRTRWGLSGSADYRLSNGSSFACAGLYSTFRNWGQKWVYTLNDGDVPSASIDWRRPDYAGRQPRRERPPHVSGMNWLTWDVSGVALADAAVGRQRRRELQVERRRRRTAWTIPARRPTPTGRVQRVVLCRRADQHDRHRELQADELEAGDRSASRRS